MSNFSPATDRYSRRLLRYLVLFPLLLLWAVLGTPSAVRAEAHGGGHGGEAAAEDEGAGPHFANINGLQIPVVQNGKVVQILILSVMLEVEKAEDIKTVEAYGPLLRDGYLSSLYGALQLQGRGGDLVNIDLVREKIDETNEKVLPPHLVRNVLLQQLQQRKP